MIRVIQAEFRKYTHRPAVRVGAALVALLVAVNYGIGLAQIIWPSLAPAGGVDISPLLPGQFVNSATGAATLSGAIAMIVGALMAGSDFGWGTLKSALTQGPGRLTTVAGRMTSFFGFTALLTAIIFAVGAAGSVVVALHQGQAIVWPAAVDAAKGFGAIWLVISVGGTLGLALGTLFKQPAAAVGAGLIYGLALQILVVRFVAGINGGSLKWLADLFEGQNSTALMQSFRPATFAAPAPDISAERAVIVLVAYVAAYLIVMAALIRQRDVA